MKLHLLRHGKTEVFSESGKDFDRALAQKGIQQAEMIGEYLNSISINSIPVFCSDATRTRQTLSQLKKKIEFTDVKYKHELYLAEANELLEFIWNLDSQNDLFIIGHNNGLSDLAGYFTDEFIDLSTCEYICIRFDIDNWKETSKGNGIISDRFHPQAF